MAKSSRGGKRGQGGPAGPSYKGELTLPDGSKIEYEGTLQYGKDDPAVAGAVRTAIEGFEKKRIKNKVEYAYSVDTAGNPIIGEIRGSKGSVRVPIWAHDTPGATFTHIHPRPAGMLGGTFSAADMHNFATFANTTLRAKAKEGAYSISKTGKFDQAGFLGYVRKIDGDFTRNYNKAAGEVNREYRSGKITYEEYSKKAAKIFNTHLVALHNDYLKGQKTYGYTYTLETTR